MTEIAPDSAASFDVSAPALPIWSPAVDLALKVCAVSHHRQTRKGTVIPYAMHPFHVAWLLARDGQREDVIIAGLLHDVVEDLNVADAWARLHFRSVFTELRGLPDHPPAFRARLLQWLWDRFGPEVQRLVLAVTDTEEPGGGKRPWFDKKQASLERLSRAREDEATLKSADSLHNTQSILGDVRELGPEAMDRFNAKPADVLWYYSSVGEVTSRIATGSRLPRELVAATQRLRQELERLGVDTERTVR